MKKILILTSLLALAITRSSAQAEGADIKAICDSILHGAGGFAENKNIMGAAIGIYYGGKTHYFTYGYANKEKSIKVNNNTLFEIGSNTKVFTALMLSSEIAKGKMDSNDYIEKYVTVNDKLKQRVRLSDIANHISGLPTFHDSASLAELINKDTTRDPLAMLTDEFSLRTLRNVDTLHNYGSYEYSNFGVGMLGYILQQQADMSYDKLLQQSICKPLGLRHTIAWTDSTGATVAQGYRKGEKQPFINLCSTMQGAGAIQSDIVDMVRFIQYQVDGAPGMNDARAISQRKYYNGEHMQLAMGWHIAQIYNTEIYEMRGDTYGASSLMFFDKEHNWGGVILLNSSSSRTTQQTMMKLLSKVLDGKSDFQKRFAKPAISVSKDILNAYAGVYELQPGYDGTVTIDGDTLCLQLPGQSKVPFKTVEQNWFVVEKLGCQVEFALNEKGVCDKMTIHQNGQDMVCKRKL